LSQSAFMQGLQQKKSNFSMLPLGNG